MLQVGSLVCGEQRCNYISCGIIAALLFSYLDNDCAQMLTKLHFFCLQPELRSSACYKVSGATRKSLEEHVDATVHVPQQCHRMASLTERQCAWSVQLHAKEVEGSALGLHTT